MFNPSSNLNNTSPAVFGTSGRPVSGMPGLGLGQNLSVAANAGRQHPNPAAKVKAPAAVPATATGVQATAKTASLINMLLKHAQGAPVPGPAGIPPAPGSAAVVPPPPPGPVPPPMPALSPIPANPRQQPPRERTEDDDKQEFVLNSVLAEGQKSRELPDRSPARELESDLMTHGKVAYDAISTFNKFSNLYKKARQDNNKPSRSAMGDANGLTYEQRKDDHATGSDAWSSLDRFRRKESSDTSLAGAFVDRCISNGLSLDQVADAIIKLGSEVNLETQNALIADLEKRAAGVPAGIKIPKSWDDVVNAIWNTVNKPKTLASVSQASRRGARNSATTPGKLPTIARPAPAAPQAAETVAPAVPAAENAAQKAAPAVDYFAAFRPGRMEQVVPRAIGAGLGGTAGYGQSDTANEPWYNTAWNVGLGALSGGILAGKLPKSKLFWPAKFGAGIGAATTTGGATGAILDTYFDSGGVGPQDPHKFRDSLRRVSGNAAFLSGLMLPGLAVAPGVGPTLQATLGYSGPLLGSILAERWRTKDDPLAGTLRELGHRTRRELAPAVKQDLLQIAPKELVSKANPANPDDPTLTWDLEKGRRYAYEGVGDAIDNYIKNKLGGFDQYVRQYSDPLFQALGYDVANMNPWQRYAMLGGGLTLGGGALMQNPYLMGAGGLMLGGGAYPQLAMAANPYFRKQFGYDLPGANPFYQAAAPPPPAQPAPPPPA